MKTFKSLSELCEEVLKGKDLSNPKNDEVGKLPEDLFGDTPELDDEGPEKAKLKEGPSQKLNSGSSTKTVEAKESTSFKGSKPAEDPETEAAEDTEEPEDALPKKMKKQLNDNFTMSAFETLFKKTITEELGEDTEAQTETPEMDDEVASEMSDEASDETDEMDEETEEESEDDGDLISDLQALHDQIGKIISRLTSEVESDESEDVEGDGDYTEEDFDDEFGSDEDEAAPVKEAKEGASKAKLLSNEHGKKMAKKSMNKVGKLKPKHAKAQSGTVKTQSKPVMVANKKGQMLQKGASVKTKVDKDDSFFD